MGIGISLNIETTLTGKTLNFTLCSHPLPEAATELSAATQLFLRRVYKNYIVRATQRS